MISNMLTSEAYSYVEAVEIEMKLIYNFAWMG